MQLFKHEKNKTLKEINFESVSESEIVEAARNSKRVEIQSRLNNLRIFIRELPSISPIETTEEKSERRRKLNAKAQLLQTIINEKDKEEAAQRQANDAKFSEQMAKERLNDLRYSFDPQITTMQTMGTMAIPLNTVTWLKPSTPIIEIQCRSGKIRKLDLSKLPSSWWKIILERPFSPFYITAEGQGMTLNSENVPVWSDQKDFKKVEEQKFHLGTVIGIMSV